MLFISKLRWIVALAVLFGIATFNLATFPQAALWRTENRAFTTVEIIQDPYWVKGTATLLAAKFKSVQVSGLAEGEEALRFDSELAEIYGIETDSAETAIDLSARPDFATELIAQDLVRFEFETFCQVEASQYCQLTLVWELEDAPAKERVDFETVRIAKSKFALVEKALLVRLAQELDLDLSTRVPR